MQEDVYSVDECTHFVEAAAALAAASAAAIASDAAAY